MGCAIIPGSRKLQSPSQGKPGKEYSNFGGGGKVPSEMKGDGSPVTEADRISNNIILSGLRENFPGYGIVSEEGDGSDSLSGPTWYVDPLDGTRSFLLGLPGFAVQIGLASEGRPVLGVVHNPPSGETVYGIVGVRSISHGPRTRRANLPSGKRGERFLRARKVSINRSQASVRCKGLFRICRNRPGNPWELLGLLRSRSSCPRVRRGCRIF